MNKLSLLVAAVLVAAPSFAAREPAQSATAAPSASADAASRNEVFERFYGLIRELSFMIPGAKVSLPEVRSMSDLTEPACADYAKACAEADVELQTRRGEFASDLKTFEFARGLMEMGLNSTAMLCSTAGRMERSPQMPYSAQRACAEERAKPEPFSDAAAAETQSAKNLDERSKRIFAAMHAAIAEQARANCDAGGY